MYTWSSNPNWVRVSRRRLESRFDQRFDRGVDNWSSGSQGWAIMNAPIVEEKEPMKLGQPWYLQWHLSEKMSSVGHKGGVACLEIALAELENSYVVVPNDRFDQNWLGVAGNWMHSSLHKTPLPSCWNLNSGCKFEYEPLMQRSWHTIEWQKSPESPS